MKILTGLYLVLPMAALGTRTSEPEGSEAAAPAGPREATFGILVL